MIPPNDWRAGLPRPILAKHPEWIDLYDDTWRIADARKQLRNGRWIFDSAFDPVETWMWDSCWILEFAKYVQGAHETVKDPAAALDLFYSSQQTDGFIPHVWPTKIDSVHNPIMAMAELSLYRLLGDQQRLRTVYLKLERLYEAVKARTAAAGSGLYRNTQWNNGMDNRPTSHFIIDLTAEQALAARSLSEIAGIIGAQTSQEHYQFEFDQLAGEINSLMWSEEDQFYTDVNSRMEKSNNWTVGAFWPLLAGVADARRAKALAAALLDPASFATPHPIPSTGKKSPSYNKDGGDYWRGSVWVPTNTMVFRGLKRFGYHGLARSLAEKHLEAVTLTWRATGTLWENYDQESPGRAGSTAKRDFVGWSGVSSIATLIDTIIGIEIDAPGRTITWNVRPREEHGVLHLKWGEKWERIVDLLAQPTPGNENALSVQVTSNTAFSLLLKDGENGRAFNVPAGKTQVQFDTAV